MEDCQEDSHQKNGRNDVIGKKKRLFVLIRSVVLQEPDFSCQGVIKYFIYCHGNFVYYRKETTAASVLVVCGSRQLPFPSCSDEHVIVKVSFIQTRVVYYHIHHHHYHHSNFMVIVSVHMTTAAAARVPIKWIRIFFTSGDSSSRQWHLSAKKH